MLFLIHRFYLNVVFRANMYASRVQLYPISVQLYSKCVLKIECKKIRFTENNIYVFITLNYILKKLN
jgi:hypothetical protein